MPAERTSGIRPEMTVDHVQRTTAFADPARAAAALRTLAWLEAGAPHDPVPLRTGSSVAVSFDMNYYISGEAGGCETACRAAGAIQQFTPGCATRDRMLEEMAEDFDFVENPELRRLFYAEDSVYSGLRIDQMPPAYAAAGLRSYLETGRVAWPKS